MFDFPLFSFLQSSSKSCLSSFERLIVTYGTLDIITPPIFNIYIVLCVNYNTFKYFFVVYCFAPKTGGWCLWKEII